MPLHAGASTDVETTRYSAMQGFLPDLALARSAFNPYLFFPGRQCHGQTVTHPLCAGLHIFRQISRRKESPFCLPGRPLFSTRPSRFSRYIILSLCFYPRQGRPYSYNRCDFMLSPDAFWQSPVWFYRCKYRPARQSLTF